VVTAASSATVRRSTPRRAASQAVTAVLNAAHSTGSCGTYASRTVFQRRSSIPTGIALSAVIASTSRSPTCRPVRLSGNPSATQMNGAASTRRLFAKISSASLRLPVSVGCGLVLLAAAGSITSSSAPSAVSAITALPPAASWRRFMSVATIR